MNSRIIGKGLSVLGMGIKPVRTGKNMNPFRRYATVKTDNIDWSPMRTTKQLVKGRELQSKKSRRVVFAIMCLTPVVTLGLGFWQLSRLKWKNQLVAECEDRLTYKPSPLPKTVTPEQIPDLEYRKVLITGHFDYSREVFVGPRLHDGQKGYLLVCPFVQSNGAGEIMVDRGWIREDMIVPEKRMLQHLSCPKGQITIECLLRVAPTKGMFHFDHETGSRLFHYVDINAMAEQVHSRPIYAQVVEDFRDRPEWLEQEKQQQGDGQTRKSWWKFWSRKTDTTKESTVSASETDAFDDSMEFSPLQFINAGVPLGKVPKIDYKNNHLQYLVTWWGLSLASAILLVISIRKGKIVNPKAEKMSHANKFLG